MNKQTIFTILLVAVLGVTGYLWYGYIGTAPDSTPSQDHGVQLTRIGQFKNIQLDTSLFSDPLFKSLTLPPVIPQPDVTPGRDNPFAAF